MSFACLARLWSEIVAEHGVSCSERNSRVGTDGIGAAEVIAGGTGVNLALAGQGPFIHRLR